MHGTGKYTSHTAHTPGSHTRLTHTDHGKVSHTQSPQYRHLAHSPHKPHTDPTQTPHRPHKDPTQTPHTIHTHHGPSGYAEGRGAMVSTVYCEDTTPKPSCGQEGRGWNPAAKVYASTPADHTYDAHSDRRTAVAPGTSMTYCSNNNNNQHSHCTKSQ